MIKIKINYIKFKYRKDTHMNKFYTVREVSEILHTNRNTVYDLIKSGELKAGKMGSLKIKEDWLDEYIENSRIA